MIFMCVCLNVYVSVSVYVACTFSLILFPMFVCLLCPICSACFSLILLLLFLEAFCILVCEREKYRVWIWASEEVGRILEELEKGKPLSEYCMKKVIFKILNLLAKKSERIDH